MKIAVYCGSRDGSDPEYVRAAKELGTWIGKSGHTLVYGAGCVGIMGAVSQAVQESGGHIIGVIPQFMVDHGWEKKDLQRIREDELPGIEAAWARETAAEDSFARAAGETCAAASPAGPAGEPAAASGEENAAVPADVLLITSSMSTRKAKMMELADVYVALPGGPGTLEEITEVISLAAVQQHEKPCILLNQDGYYDPLRRMYDRMLEQEFTEGANLTRMYYAADVGEIVRIAQTAK